MAEQAQDYYTTAEVAARYRVTPGTVRYWRHVGYGPKGVRNGRRVLYPRAAIEAHDRRLAARAGSTAAIA
jgi:DNA-binding transcriptional MerR regulator